MARAVERQRALRIEIEGAPKMLAGLAASILAGHEPGLLGDTTERDVGFARPRIELERATRSLLGIREHRPAVTHAVIAP